MKRIDIAYEVNAKNSEEHILCYALNNGGAVISVFTPDPFKDKHPKHYTFACDSDFINFADKIKILADEVKRRS